MRNAAKIDLAELQGKVENAFEGGGFSPNAIPTIGSAGTFVHDSQGC